MTTSVFLPIAEQWWRHGLSSRPLAAFLDAWSEHLAAEREDFLSVIRSMRLALLGYHVVTPVMLDAIPDHGVRRECLAAISRDPFAPFSGQRYALEMTAFRAAESPALLEVALGLRSVTREELAEEIACAQSDTPPVTGA